jgi:protein TonB
METKKNKDKNADALRMPLALTGLLFTGGLVLASFSYVTPVLEELENQSSLGDNEISYVQEEATPPKDIPVPEENTYVAPPQVEIIIDSNTITPPTPTPPVLPPMPVIGPPVIPVVAAQIIDFPDVEAGFIGGSGALQTFIVSNVVYPETSIDMDEQGKVYLSFIVEEDGKISHVTVERGVSKDLDREAKRIVRAMPNWEAGEVKGKKVRTRCRLPIVFTLH